MNIADPWLVFDGGQRRRSSEKATQATKVFLDASPEMSLAYHESQECSYFTEEHSLMHYTQAYYFAFFQGDPVAEVELSVCS